MKIHKNSIRNIIEHAKEELPIEACGYLAGKNGIITQHFRMTNIDNSPEHFSFDPKEQFETIRKAREGGLTIFANYHSHPVTPARPSKEDIRLAYDSNILYLIISLAEKEPVVNAYKIIKGEVEKIFITEIE